MDPLFPELPDDLKALSDEEVAALLKDHESAAELINADDEEFLKGLDGNEIISQYEAGVNQIQLLRGEMAERTEAHAAYQAKKQELAAQVSGEVAEEDNSGDEDEGEEEAAPVEVVAEAEAITEEAAEEVVEEKELVTASVDTPRFSRRAPAPVAERIPEPTKQASGTALVASAQWKANHPDDLDQQSLAALAREVIVELGPAQKTDEPGKHRTYSDSPGQVDVYSDGRRVEVQGRGGVIWDGPRTKMARAEFTFPEERTLNGIDDTEKIRAVMPSTVNYLGIPGGHGGEALIASGGLCAPLTPIYSMPNFGTEAEPVWDALPVFRAARGGVNVPDATYVGDITSAISSISEEEDALGGTFATKSCQDLDCPDYTEVAVQILAHCREYGNLNARAWPEKIAHENALTMQALSRTSEGFMLDRIKALSVNVTNGADTLGALIYLVDAIVKAAFGIRGRLRMPEGARFRALLPTVILDLLVLDNIQTQFDRFRSRGELDAYLRSVGIDPVYYLDTASTGESQLPDASQAAGALDGLPDTIQWAIYPEGAFLGIDSGVLELGIVRDSTLNSTNDFQVFGERFRNVARLAPAQGCYWVTTDLCPVGTFPPAGTARTCESAG